MMHSYNYEKMSMINPFGVLILVVMDDALVHDKVSGKVSKLGVLILVVMDDALVQSKKVVINGIFKGLNPCCNG